VPNARAIHRRLLDRGFLAGLALADAEPDDAALADALLVCATEVTTSEEIVAFATALEAELAGSADRRSSGDLVEAGR
jgi:glycine dehydrogenase subunit 1